MITKFIELFMASKPRLEALFSEKHPADYIGLVRAVVEVLDDDTYNAPDPKRIHELNDGDYQGTLVYVIAAKGYQPSDYWYVKVAYGSCSGCDTLQSIRGYSDSPPDEAASGGLHDSRPAYRTRAETYGW